LDHNSDFFDFAFDSILDVEAVENANLEVDRRVVIPKNVYISLTVTSTDVIHSWAVPQLGIKVDAIPGRIANSVLFTFTNGVYYGQCSELCGVLHGFMPICIESVNLPLFFIFVIANIIYNDLDYYSELA
jgi:cytochrome c oxidase subunit 2